jgi:phospholipase C
VDDYVTGEEQTADLTHKFYTHQFQINGGKLDKFVTWSSAGGIIHFMSFTTSSTQYKLTWVVLYGYASIGSWSMEGSSNANGLVGTELLRL